MKTFIRVAEVWLPDQTGSLLEWGGGLYPDAPRFKAQSQALCFGRGEGLPGQAWEQRRPIVLKQFEGSYFRRTRAALAEGLSCGVALPVFAGQSLMAVLLLFCGDDADHAGAIELWHNDPADPVNGADLTLDDGYYGNTAEVFEFISRQTAFRPGHGLPGLAWQSGQPVFMPDLGKGTRFLRADSAVRVGINRGLALPCATPGTDAGHWVIAFLSALATPIARRVECWTVEAGGAWLSDGFCEATGLLTAAGPPTTVEAGQGPIGQAVSRCVPVVCEAAHTLQGPVGDGARAAGASALLTLPVLRNQRVAAVVAWYL